MDNYVFSAAVTRNVFENVVIKNGALCYRLKENKQFCDNG